MNLPTLDTVVLDTLTFFEQTPPPVLDLSRYTMPIVVGSGNAINTGKIIFSEKAAIFADESSFKSVIAAYEPVISKGLISNVVVLSASGEKDSVWETELAKEKGLKTTLLTCKGASSAAKIADEVIVYKSIAEPYTYNTSTYLGMILSATHESPKNIRSLIETLALAPGFADYTSYAFVLPDKYIQIAPMIEIKGDELFGPHVMVRAFPEGHARHAKFVHPWDKELVISIGMENRFFGDSNHRWDIPLPASASYGTVMALTYFICGMLQKAKPDYFMQHIEAFCTDYGPKAYGKPNTFDVIVPASQ